MHRREDVPPLSNMERRMIARNRAEFGRKAYDHRLPIRHRLESQMYRYPCEAHDLRYRRARRLGNQQ